MKKVQVSEVASNLAEYLQNLGDEPVVLMNKRKPVAVLMPVGNADLETISLSLNPKFNKMLEESYISARTKGGISSDELRRRLGLPANGSLDEPVPDAATESAADTRN